ncbi:MAG: transposase [Selenomonadaceae bacterium]
MQYGLRRIAFHLEEEVTAKALVHPYRFLAFYGEFLYQTKRWDYPRRVICKIEKRPKELFVRHTFIVTNMALSPQKLVQFCCNRGRMENFINKSKNKFGFATMSSHSIVVNANRLQIYMLAYNLFNWFRRLCLPEKMKKFRTETIRLKLLKIAGNTVKVFCVAKSVVQHDK